MLSEYIHNPVGFEGVLLLMSFCAGLLGSILGLGGGVIIVPALTILMGVNIRYAVGASIVSVIATSSGAAAAYVRDHITNLRVAMILETATTVGALSGGILSGYIHSEHLYLLFASMLVFSGGIMFFKRSNNQGSPPNPKDTWARVLKLNSNYYDPHLKQVVHYGVTRVGLGWFLMLAAGVLSGLLGIGSGALKVPAMDTAMNLPIKVSSATSNFMIGVTAAASAGLYYMKGAIIPLIAAPVALGVLAGSLMGSRWMLKIKGKNLRVIFIFVIIVIATQMFMRGLGGANGE